MTRKQYRVWLALIRPSGTGWDDELTASLDAFDSCDARIQALFAARDRGWDLSRTRTIDVRKGARS